MKVVGDVNGDGSGGVWVAMAVVPVRVAMVVVWVRGAMEVVRVR